ncbi:hypothetical protein AURDEDRAFT_124081 [Auricularia subglabra TFB-10046 SS5]|nr:hypothetical protein AURDEDRAFT_124081 [Auricularia subglabra TFB-10046 SS5]
MATTQEPARELANTWQKLLIWSGLVDVEFSESQKNGRMATRDLISEVPVELAHRILCMFNYLELLPVAGTCRRWREIATDCPSYWRHIQLATPTDGEAQTLSLRLRSAKGRPSTVYVHAPMPWPTLSATILPVIASSFSSLSWLNIYVHVSHADQVLQILTQPAWNLTVLEVAFETDNPHEPLPVLPGDLLHGCAPRLTTVWIENVDIPYPPPALFGSICIVGFGFQQEPTLLTEVPNLWSYFPNMRTLILAGAAIIGDCLLSSDLWNSLEWLRFRTYDTALEHTFKHTLLPIAEVPHVELPCAIPDIVECIIPHISGPLQVAIEAGHESITAVRVHFGGVTWERSRSFLTELSDWDGNLVPPFDLWSRVDFVGRIVSLTLPSFVWRSVTEALLPLDSLQELRVVLEPGNGGLDTLASDGRIIFPALRSLVLRVDQGECYLSLESILSFIPLCLPSATSHLEGVLEGVTLVNPTASPINSEKITLRWRSRNLWE